MTATPGVQPRLLLLALCLWAAAGVAAAGPLPKLAVSLPAGVAPADVARLVRACGSDDVLIVLAPITVRLGDGADATAPSTVAADVPPKAYLRLRVEVADVAAAGRDRETLIERQAADIVRLLALDRPEVAGIVIESSAAPNAADIQQFALATLIVKAKGVRPDLAIALEAPEGPARPRLLATDAWSSRAAELPPRDQPVSTRSRRVVRSSCACPPAERTASGLAARRCLAS